MAESLISIPENILNFQTAPICSNPVTVNHRNRSAVRALYKQIQSGNVYVGGNLAQWLQIKIDNKQTSHVIRMLHHYRAVRAVSAS